MKKKRVLFVCTHNSARSQMAEGILRHLYWDRYEVFSAGTKPSSVHPMAIKVMKEVGIDISDHRSKSVYEFLGEEFDYVITVCDSAREECPYFPGAKRYLHRSFVDPSSADEDKMLEIFRKVRDEIFRWIEITFGE